MAATVIVRRVFGRTPDKEKIDAFTNWFADNIDKLEDVIDEVKPYNGQMLLDYQDKTQSYIVEVQTTELDFANEIKAKYEELQFIDSAIIGDVKTIKGVQ